MFPPPIKLIDFVYLLQIAHNKIFDFILLKKRKKENISESPKSVNIYG
jgi:hypothetical protein